MDGGKKRHGQRWCLVAALKKLWLLTLVKRIAPPSYSRNGMHTAMVLLNTAKGESGDRLFHQGVHLLETFARNNRVRIDSPKKNLQIKMLRAQLGGSEFVSYLDAIGEIDGQHCLIDWKTTTSRYSAEPEGLLSLDPQLICYSWINGIPEVALVVFVRKHAPEIQYLRATISEEQRQEFGRLVETTISQIEGARFVSHTGIRFPQNGCMSCPHLGLCLNNEQLVAANLIRRPGASELDRLDELVD